MLVVIDPNNPTGAIPASVRRALIDFAERHDLTILADEVYGDLGFEGPVPPLGTLDTGRADHFAVEPVEGLSGAGLARGWLVVSPTRRLDDALAAMKKLADGRLCSPGPMQYAIVAALTGDRSHQPRSARRWPSAHG